MSSAGGRPSWQTMVSVGTSIVPPGPRPPPADTPGHIIPNYDTAGHSLTSRLCRVPAKSCVRPVTWRSISNTRPNGRLLAVVIPVRRTAQSPRILQVLRVTSRIMPFIRLHLASRAAHGDHQGADIAQSGGDQVGRGEDGELCAPFRRQGSRGTPTRDRAIPVATDSLKSGRSLRHAVPPWIYSHARPNC